MLRPESRRAAALAAVGLALAAPAAGAAAAAAGPTYPVHVEIALAKKSVGAMFHHGIGPSLFAPPNPSCSVSIGDQARAAYAAVARRMFRAGGVERAASLEIGISAADLDLDVDGWHAQVEHALVLRSASGVEMGRWSVTGRERVEGLGETAIPRAFRSAAEKAASRFEAAFAEPPGVARWLADSGVVLASVPRAQLPPDVPLVQSRPPGPPRSWALFVDGGAGSFIAAQVKDGRDERTALPALALRVGGAAPWGFVQLAYARTTEIVDKTSLEAGPLFRIRPDVDLKIGGGVARVSAPEGARTTVASVLAALSLALPVTRGTLWMRLGLEARYDFGASLMVPNEDLTARYDAARGASGWAFIGFELGTPE
ncbi:MAG TPA: hypothetical protein VIV57_05275 [Anaeromyxobacter sp.]